MILADIDTMFLDRATCSYFFRIFQNAVSFSALQDAALVRRRVRQSQPLQQQRRPMDLAANRLTLEDLELLQNLLLSMNDRRPSSRDGSAVALLRTKNNGPR